MTRCSITPTIREQLIKLYWEPQIFICVLAKCKSCWKYLLVRLWESGYDTVAGYLVVPIKINNADIS